MSTELTVNSMLTAAIGFLACVYVCMCVCVCVCVCIYVCMYVHVQTIPLNTPPVNPPFKNINTSEDTNG